MSRVDEQAGLQLFLRVDWEHPAHEDLASHLGRAVAGGDDWEGCRAVLVRHHGEAQDELGARVDGVTGRLARLRYTRSVKHVARLEQRLVRLRRDLIVMPLSPPRISVILGLASRSNADQLRSRYRRALPRLLSETIRRFPALEELLEDHREAIQP